MNKSLTRTRVCFLGAVVVPFLIAWVYLYVSRTRHMGTGSDNTALGVCLIVGLASIAASPIKKVTRVLLSILYVPALSFVLFLFAVIYVCTRFGDCL